jgi:F-box protein 9
MEENNPELESFRQQWRAEVSARSRVDDSNINPKVNKSQPTKPSLRRLSGQSRLLSENGKVKQSVNEEASEGVPTFESFNINTKGRLYDDDDIEGFGIKAGSREPRSALEHYEKAVERESQGNLGDSLSLYRKAFKVGSPY